MDTRLQTAQVMTTEVPAVPLTATLQEAAAMLQGAGVALLPVSDAERVVGAIGVQDLAFKGCAAGRDPTVTQVREILTGDSLACRPDMPAAQALHLLRRHHLAAALVLDGEHRLVGVIHLHRLLDCLDADEPHGPEPEYVRRVRGDAFEH